MAEALIVAGAPIDAVDQHGVTALMEAARAGSNRVLQRLMFRKPSVDALDQAGRDALIIACQSRRANEDTVRMLLTLGVQMGVMAVVLGVTPTEQLTSIFVVQVLPSK